MTGPEAAPPRIPGYSHQRLLGVGGSAQVYLYEQQLPRRAVAVKVLLAAVDDTARAAFEREADLTARLSHHPSIVTVYQAGIAEDGRPYLVMEYCSRPGLGPRYRSERVPVAEVLQIGVRLACAVETAHRAGIVHRDIKPGNVLTNDFGRPVLGDFGIAATVDVVGPAVGMSVPWAAPELLGAEPHADERSDVYSLGATLFSALAGRSPFERPGGQNAPVDLVGRIERGSPVPLTRDDVPERLRTVLARAMARDPRMRHSRAVDLAYDLRAVQEDLGLAVTPLDLGEDLPDLTSGVDLGPDEEAERMAALPEGGLDLWVSSRAQVTRVRPVVEVAADAGVRGEHAGGDQSDQSDRVGGRGPTGGAGTPGEGAVGTSSGAQRSGTERSGTERSGAQRSETEQDSGSGIEAGGRDRDRAEVRVTVDPGPPRHRRPGRRAAVVVIGLLLVAAVVVAVLLTRDTGRTPTDQGTDFVAPRQTVATRVPAPVGLSGQRADDGSVTFTWTNPDPMDGDTYLWGLSTTAGTSDLAVVEKPEVTVEAADQTAGEQVCIEVYLVRDDRRMSATPTEECVP